MIDLSPKEIEIFSNKILEDYDNKNPGSIFKEKKRITNEEALLVQSNVAKLRQKEEKRLLVIKLDVFQKIHKRKWVLINLPVVTYGTLNFIRVEQL